MQIKTVEYSEANTLADKTKSPGLFSDLTKNKIFPITHNENDFDDYKREILIPHKMSTL